MIVVVPFCAHDAEQAMRLLSWMGQLGGSASYHCLLCVDAALPWSAGLDAVNLAGKFFRSVKLITNEAPVSGWIAGSNSLFFAAAKHIEKEHLGPWLWMEPDAAPLEPRWLDRLESAYANCGKAFMGHVYKCDSPNLPRVNLSGIAVYPEDAWSRLQQWSDSPLAFDIACAYVTVPAAHHTSLIEHFWGTEEQPPTFTPGQPNTLLFNAISPHAVIFHRCKDASLIRRLKQKYYPATVNQNVFAHGGDVGDLIYGLPAMRAIGGGSLVLHWHGVRESFSAEKVARLAPLLRLQPYLEDVYFQHDPPNTPWNFNPFRQWNWDRRSGRIESLAESQCRIFRLPEFGLHQQWLWVDRPTVLADYPVVVHRSPRYHNDSFPWGQIFQKYKGKMVFVGMPEEHADLCGRYGQIPRHQTKDYLELARVIAGARLFIGNQSCPYAIAEGLKQNAILEVFPYSADCQFRRSNLQNQVNGLFVELPDL